MGKDETVEVDEDRELNLGVLGDLETDDAHVVGLLDVLAEDGEPSGVPGGHDVTVVVVDVDGSADGPVGDCHHDRYPHGGGDGEHLPHVGETLGRGCGEGPGACGGGGGTEGQSGVLGLDVDELGVDLSVRYVLCEVLDDDGLRGDGVGCAHIGVQLLPCESDCTVSVDGEVLSCFSGHWMSSFMVMAFLGQTLEQIPQPLQ